jgi:hypothetical protein
LQGCKQIALRSSWQVGIEDVKYKAPTWGSEFNGLFGRGKRSKVKGLKKQMQQLAFSRGDQRVAHAKVHRMKESEHNRSFEKRLGLVNSGSPGVRKNS